MSESSKSAMKTVRMAYRLASEELPAYSHPSSPRLYTQAQLFACLVLKTTLRFDYRRVVIFLHDFPEIRAAIGMTRVPHFTTLQKACQRLLRSSLVESLLVSTTRVVSGKKKPSASESLSLR